MKKFVIKSVAFIIFCTLFFVLINILYIGIIIKTDFEFRKRIEMLNFHNPDFELVALGTSLVLDGFDTEMLTSHGIKSYNLALGGSGIKTSYIQLNEYLATHMKRPRYVLLGVNSVLEDFCMNDIHPIIDVTEKGHKYNLNDVPILKFKWLGFEFFKKIISRNHRKARLSYGQVKFQKATSDDTFYKELYLNTKLHESSYWIGEIARLCNQTGIELLIIEMPGYKETQNLSEIGPYELCFHNEYTADLYNLNNKDFCTIFDKDKDWIAKSHLNEFGAIKLTKELIRIIER